MSENLKSEKIGVTALCRISAKGGEGVYLYIPRNFATAYKIVGAEYAEINFRKIFRKTAAEEQKDICEEEVKDLTSRKKPAEEEDDELAQGEL